MCVSLSLYYDVKFGGSHYVMHFLVFISYRYINYMCAFKLPVDQEYAIRQSFAAFLLLTPLFFSEFLGSNDKGNGGPGLKQNPVAPPTGDRGLSPLGWATGASSPWGGGQAPIFFFLQGLRCKFEEKKNYI